MLSAVAPNIYVLLLMRFAQGTLFTARASRRLILITSSLEPNLHQLGAGVRIRAEEPPRSCRVDLWTVLGTRLLHRRSASLLLSKLATSDRDSLGTERDHCHRILLVRVLMMAIRYSERF